MRCHEPSARQAGTGDRLRNLHVARDKLLMEWRGSRPGRTASPAYPVILATARTTASRTEARAPAWSL